MINEWGEDFIVQLDLFMEKHFYQEFVSLVSLLPYDDYINLIVTFVQINGLAIENENPVLYAMHRKGSRQGLIRYKEVSLRFESKVIKVILQQQKQTPFSLVKNELYLDKWPLDIKLYPVSHNENDRNNGFYFPQKNGIYSFDFIRFNPLNTGRCPGNCVFCHRCYHLPTKEETINRKRWTINELIDRTINVYGVDFISNAKHVLLATELFGNTNTYLDYCKRLKEALRLNGFSGKYTALAQEIRNPTQISEFYDIVDGDDFCYTFECYENRDKIMSSYKGLKVEKVYSILNAAKQKGFCQIRINYIAGLDSLHGFYEMIQLFSDKINSIGLNLFTPQTDKQFQIRNKEANSLFYYYKIIETLKEQSIKISCPDFYERFPAIGIIN